MIDDFHSENQSRFSMDLFTVEVKLSHWNARPKEILDNFEYTMKLVTHTHTHIPPSPASAETHGNYCNVRVYAMSIRVCKVLLSNSYSRMLRVQNLLIRDQ